MRIREPLMEATFVRSLSRFAPGVRIARREHLAHLPKSGALGEILKPEAQPVLAHRPARHRSTEYDLICVRHGDAWVSEDARRPTPLFAEALSAGRVGFLAR